jgi:hypothetical protein
LELLGPKIRATRRGRGLEQIRKLAEEDVTLLGEELGRLDSQARERRLDPEYQAAIDAYEAAQQAVKGVRTADEISSVAETLATAHYAIACVDTRIRGEPVPERRVPCFLNPQHGPSTSDIIWTQPRVGTRTVPACPQDAERIHAGDGPEIRFVEFHGRRVPYWEAGDAAASYGLGYFAVGTGPSYFTLTGLGTQDRAIGGWKDPEKFKGWTGDARGGA